MNPLEQAQHIFKYVVQMRRQFHSYPEPSLEEYVTTEAIAGELDKMHIPYRRLEPTGIIGEITGGKPGKTVALRADIDALAIKEKSGVEFVSKNDGFMHACGHDTHTAMLLGAASILNSSKEHLCGKVRLIFQPGEESGKGAKLVIEQGGIEGADALLGIHIYSQAYPGCFTTKAGSMLPSADTFSIKVKGVSCHGATPNIGVDATLAAAVIVMNLQSIVSREVDPLIPIVVTIGSLHSGTAYNIISGEALMEGTVRVFDNRLRNSMPGILERIAGETASAYRCTAQVKYEFGSSALVTDAAVTEIAKKAALKILPSPKLFIEFKGAMGSEDFAEYTPYIPSAYVVLGGGGEYPQHSDHFVIEEKAMINGIALYVQFIEDFLQVSAT